MKAKLYAIEREETQGTVIEPLKPIIKVGFILEPENLEDEIVLEFIDAKPERLVIKTSGRSELDGKWSWRKREVKHSK